MDAKVLQFAPRDPGYAGLVCECGEAWFTVEAVALDQEGNVTGYSGTPKCRVCGSPQNPHARGSAL